MKKDIVVSSPTPATLLEKAIEKGVDMTQLKELMDLQERWEKKEAKKAFLDALSKFQTMVPSLKKNKTANIPGRNGGTGFSYKYSDLGSIGASIKVAMQACGLSYRWEFKEVNAEMEVTCLISHKAGHTESTSMKGHKDDSGAKNNIQQKGSTQTYLQRYTLIGALGLTTADEDNDGAGANSTFKKKEAQPVKPVSDEEFLDQWRQTLVDVKSRIELTGLFIKNKKIVESTPSIQALFKARESELKQSETANKTQPVLP